MKVSVVVCEICNATATNGMTWIQNEEDDERLACKCGSQAFTLLDVDEELVPEGSLVVQKEERE